MQNTSHYNLAELILKTFLLIVCFAALLSIYGFIKYSNRGIDLVEQDQNWQYFPGAQITYNGINFLPLNRIILHQDGSAGQPNPPVNIGGYHLKVNGDFKVTFIASKIDQEASFRLYAFPPIVYDQWRYESPSIEILIDNVKNLINARIWDGNSSNSMDIRTYEISLNSQTIVSIEHIQNKINIIANNQILGNMPDHDIFQSGNIWFGADAKPKSTGWVLSSLYAKPIGIGRVEVVPPPSLAVNHNDKNSLRNLADANKRKIKIGSTVSLEPLLVDEQYRVLALSQFSTLTPENSMKPLFIHPEINTYSFEQADQLVDITLKNNIAVHGHVLVYHKSNPEWMAKSHKSDRQKIMVSHIENVVSHFKGKVAGWDVVNEPFSKKNALYKDGKTGLEPNIWFEAMGEEYIDLAFKTARKADPLAKLYLNDYGFENNGQHWDALLSLVKRLKQRNVPIDGIGFESHIYTDGDYINAKELKEHMKILAELGLLTRISEIDVTQDDEKEHINQYATALDVCLQSPNCTSYTTWGISDLYGSTTRSDRYPLTYGTSLIWDKELKAKPVYKALQERLLQP